MTKAGGDNRIGKERLMKVSHHPGSEEEARSLGAGAGVAEGEEPRVVNKKSKHDRAANR